MKPDQEAKIDFLAPAILRKWPSVNKERVSASLGAPRYMIVEGTLEECIRRFMSQPKSQHHLYEIHTAPQSEAGPRRSCPTARIKPSTSSSTALAAG